MTPSKWWPLGQTPSDGESEPVKYVTKEDNLKKLKDKNNHTEN